MFKEKIFQINYKSAKLTGGSVLLHVLPPARGRSGCFQLLCCGLRAPDAPRAAGPRVWCSMNTALSFQQLPQQLANKLRSLPLQLRRLLGWFLGWGCFCLSPCGWREGWALLFRHCCSAPFTGADCLGLEQSSWCPGTAGAHRESRAGWNDPALVQVHKQPGSQWGTGTWTAHRARAHFVYLGFGNLPVYLRKDNGLTFPGVFFSSKLAPSDRFSLLCAPLQSEFSAIPGSCDTSKYLPNSQQCEVPLFYCANLILQRTKPKDLQLPRCHFFILWHAQKFCCNFLLSSLGLMRLKRIIGRK